MVKKIRKLEVIHNREIESTLSRRPAKSQEKEHFPMEQIKSKIGGKNERNNIKENVATESKK